MPQQFGSVDSSAKGVRHSTKLMFFLLQFDTLPAVPDEITSPIGVYNGLNFSNLFVNQPGVPGIITLNGVAPKSDPNQALGGLSKQASTISVPATGPAKTFSLDSFYYGCSVDTAQGLADPAQPCNITVTGYSSGKVKVSQKFNFVPIEKITLMQAPVFGAFKGFSGLDKATFVQTPGNPAAVLLIDDLVGSYQKP